jgi:hypothetical protein
MKGTYWEQRKKEKKILSPLQPHPKLKRKKIKAL